MGLSNKHFFDNVNFRVLGSFGNRQIMCLTLDALRSLPCSKRVALLSGGLDPAAIKIHGQWSFSENSKTQSRSQRLKNKLVSAIAGKKWPASARVWLVDVPSFGSGSEMIVNAIELWALFLDNSPKASFPRVFHFCLFTMPPAYVANGVKYYPLCIVFMMQITSSTEPWKIMWKQRLGWKSLSSSSQSGVYQKKIRFWHACMDSLAGATNPCGTLVYKAMHLSNTLNLRGGNGPQGQL